MNRAEEIAALISEVVPRLDALRDAAMEEIEEASETARKNVDRHARASEELGQVEAQIARLQAERESLPVQVSRANLDEDFELEDNLRERYLSLKQALEALEQRRGSLREELARLSSLGDSHPSNVVIEQYAEVASVAASPRHELEALRKKLSEALDAAVDPVIQRHESLKSTTWQLSHERAWAESPVGRGPSG